MPEAPRQNKSLHDTAARWVARRDAGLAPAEAREFDEWLTADPAHRAAIAQLDAIWGALDRPYLAQAEGEFLRQLALRQTGRRRRRTAMAAAALVILALGVVDWTRVRESHPEDVSSQAPVVVVHLPNRQVLPDGSLVEFKTGARYSVEFAPHRRRIVLEQGEAHFAVAKDPSRPFVVEADGIAIHAVGTAFSVQLGERAVEVVVTEGRVEVATPQAAVTEPRETADAIAPVPARPPVATLDAGHMAVVDRAAAEAAPQVMVIQEAELYQRMAWRAPRLEFTKTPLAEAVALLNEHGAHPRGLRFVIADPELAQVRVGGLFRVDNTDAFIQLLHTGFGIEVETRGTEMLLRRAR
jgi:transmembrane sensor